MTRLARQYVLLHPEDCDPSHGLDMYPGSLDWWKVERLKQAFSQWGFYPGEPALVGYPHDGRVQLLSGTHRHLAAKQLGMMLPVTLKLRSVVEAAWGTNAWEDIIRDIPVKDLELAPVKKGDVPSGLDERVDLSSSDGAV
jgi:hypothetical protein